MGKGNLYSPFPTPHSPLPSRRLLKDYLLLLAQPFEHFGSRAVADADLDGLAFAAFGLARRRNFNRGVALLVVNHGAFRDEQRALVFFQDNLGVGGHIGAQQIARVVDGDFDLERHYVVLIHAERRNLRDLAVEYPVLERLDFDPRRLVEFDYADVGLVNLAAHVDLADVAEHHHQRRRRAHIQDRRDRRPDLDVAREDHSADRRADGRVIQLLFCAVYGGLRLGDLGLGLRDFRLAHAELRAGDVLAVQRQFVRAARVVVRLLRQHALLQQPLGAFEIAFGEWDVGAFGFYFVLFKLGLGGFQVGFRADQRGFGFADARGRVFLVEFGQRLSRRDDVAHLNLQLFDDAVGLRFDFDLGDRLDAARGDDRTRDVAALDHGQSRRVNFGRRARHYDKARHAQAAEDGERAQYPQ